MWPEIFSFGPLTLHSYGLLIAAGVFLALFLMKRRAAGLGFPAEERVFDLLFVAVMSGFAGARLLYVFQEWDWYRTHPLDIFKIWEGGLIYYGGMMAGFLGFFLYVRGKGLPFLQSSDFVIPYLPLVHAFGRLGCFLNGCCYGKPCALAWGVKFPELARPVHPTQLYEAVFNFALFGLLVRRDPRRHPAGETTALYLMLYPAGRFFIEFLRGDQALFFFYLTAHQVVSVVFISIGVCLYGLCRRPT